MATEFDNKPTKCDIEAVNPLKFAVLEEILRFGSVLDVCFSDFCCCLSCFVIANDIELNYHSKLDYQIERQITG